MYEYCHVCLHTENPHDPWEAVPNRLLRLGRDARFGPLWCRCRGVVLLWGSILATGANKLGLGLRD